MQWTGLPIETVGWMAAGAALIITLLYLLKFRKRSVEIPFSPLWGRVIATRRKQSDWWRRLKRLLSWLLHLLIAGLLLFAMLGPRSTDEVLDGRHLLILIDNSASMGATDVTGGVNRLDVAQRQAREILQTVGGDDRVMVALFNNRVQPLGPFVDDPTLLESALRNVEVTANPTDLAQALSFAAHSLQDRPDAELIILSDGSGFDPEMPLPFDPDLGISLRHIMIGEASENLAITAFNARRYPSNRLDHELYVEVTSHFDREVSTRLDISADGRLVDSRTIDLGPREVHRQFYPGQAVAGERLEARIRLTTADARDVFPLDDRAYATVPPPRRLSVQLVSPGNLFIEGPLLLNSHIDFDRVHPDAFDSTASRDVFVFDRFAPESLPDGDLLFFDPPAEGSPFEISGRDDDPILTDVRQSHPLMRWISLSDLNIGSTSTFRRGSDDVDVASTFGRTVILARDDGTRRMVALGFDVRNSDFPLRVAFPVFMLNVLDYFAQDDVDLMYSFATGETWSIPIDRSVTGAEMVRPDGTRAPVALHAGEALFYGEQPGFYELHTTHADGTDRTLLAANLTNPDESEITPRLIEWEEIPTAEDTSGLLFDRREIWISLLLAAMALLFLEWTTYQRRWTE